VHIEDGGQHLIVPRNALEGFLGDVGAGRCHGRHGVAFVERLVMREDVRRHHPGIALDLSEVDDPA
jgi:hypothetical protein